MNVTDSTYRPAPRPEINILCGAGVHCLALVLGIGLQTNLATQGAFLGVLLLYVSFVLVFGGPVALGALLYRALRQKRQVSVVSVAAWSWLVGFFPYGLFLYGITPAPEWSGIPMGFVVLYGAGGGTVNALCVALTLRIRTALAVILGGVLPLAAAILQVLFPEAFDLGLYG